MHDQKTLLDSLQSIPQRIAANFKVKLQLSIMKRDFIIGCNLSGIDCEIAKYSLPNHTIIDCNQTKDLATKFHHEASS
jgi:hypothetical protein